MMAQTKLQRYLFDLSRIPPKDREQYLKLMEGLSNSGIDMVDRNGHFAGWYTEDHINILMSRLPASLTVCPYPPGHRTDGR